MKLIGTYLRPRWTERTTTTSAMRDSSARASDIAASLTSSNTVSGYVDATIFGTDYWAPTTSNVEMFGAKLSHAIDPTTFYEATIQRFSQSTDTNPGTLRDTAKRYEIVPGYFVNEMPFGYWPYSTGCRHYGMRMGVGMSNSRDTSRCSHLHAKFDITSQLDKYNQVKAGLELATRTTMSVAQRGHRAAQRPVRHRAGTTIRSAARSTCRTNWNSKG